MNINIRESTLLKSLDKELRDFELKCRNTIQNNMKIWQLESVPEVFEIGKGIRPALHFFFSKALKKITEVNFVYAMLAEMLHFATLAHDDVLDEALIRRLNGTLKATYGNFKAILIGDLILAVCYRIASKLGNPQFLRLLADTSYKVCQGEIMQHNEKFNFYLTENQYLDIIYHKTAVLFGFSCCLADFNNKLEPVLYRIGTKIGLLYQIIDDFLDIYSSHKIIGKSTGKDLSKGIITLPVVILFKIADQQDIRVVKKMLLSGNGDTLLHIKKLFTKYRIRDRICDYVDIIYKEIMRESNKILLRNDIDILSGFLNTLIRYI